MPNLSTITRLGTLLAKHAHAVKAVGTEAVDDSTLVSDGEDFARSLELYGPTYVKFGQLLSTREDLLPAAYTQALARLQDGVEPGPVAEVRAAIEESLGASVSTLFSWFDDTPLAAASLAQVHRATTRNGRDVVVKVLRPGVRDVVRADLDELGQLADFIDQRTPLGPRLGASRMLGQFRRSMSDELDYRKEAANLALFAQLAADEPDLLIPGVVADYSSDSVLTLDRIAGKKVTDVTPLGLLDIDGAKLAASLFRFMLRSMLLDGVLHADPHPGNLLVTPEGRLGLIDLGMVVRLPKPIRGALVKLLVSIGDTDGDAAASILVGMGHPLDDFDAASFRDEVSHLVSSTLALGSDIQAGTVLMELARLSGAHGLRPPAEMTMVAKALLNLDRATQHLDPDFSPLEAIRENLATIIQAGLQPSLGATFVQTLEGKEFLEGLPRRANRIMRSLADGEFEVRVKAFDENRVLSVLGQAANRLTAGMVIAAMIVAGALLMFVDAGPSVFGYPALAAVVFLLAMVGGIWLGFGILWHDLPIRRRARRTDRRERLG
ncbi:MAG TPA: AarF/UbiB family protein [Propionibacteriaceae bacterium]|nr:AarF/UbiB family protein [Propionibacteriaceae bacterium]